MQPERTTPGPGQESVWDYPRPPRIVPSAERITVALGGVVIAETTRSLRVLETSQPPAYYLPPEDVDLTFLHATDARSLCEWKGIASYFDVDVGHARVPGAAWTYRDPTPAFAGIKDHVAFYAQHLDCHVDGERVRSNEGAFYGGWITSRVVGPFKGGPGTAGW